MSTRAIRISLRHFRASSAAPRLRIRNVDPVGCVFEDIATVMMRTRWCRKKGLGARPTADTWAQPTTRIGQVIECVSRRWGECHRKPWAPRARLPRTSISAVRIGATLAETAASHRDMGVTGFGRRLRPCALVVDVRARDSRQQRRLARRIHRRGAEPAAAIIQHIGKKKP